MDLHRLKRVVKRGPRMSREMRAEYLLCQAGVGPRRLSPAVLAKLKSEIVRVGRDGGRQGFEFAEKMFRRYPELREA